MSDLVFDGENKTRTIEKLGEFRLIGAHQHPQILGPTLQEAYRCREDGSISWRTINIQWLPADEYFAKVRGEDEK